MSTQPGGAPHGGIFVSYRRDDTRHVAGRLYDRLADRFGSTRIFMDVDSIEPGVDFTSAVEAAVTSCTVLIALIGPSWLTLRDNSGRRRLDDPNDFVVAEIAAALRRGIMVLPVLTDGTLAPSPEDLPVSIAPLARRQAVRLDHETFGSDLRPLLSTVARAFEAGADNASVQPDVPPENHTRGKLEREGQWKKVWDDLPPLTPPRAGESLGTTGHFRYRQRKSAENQARQLNLVFEGHPTYDPAISNHIVAVGAKHANFYPLIWQWFSTQD